MLDLLYKLLQTKKRQTAWEIPKSIEDNQYLRLFFGFEKAKPGNHDRDRRVYLLVLSLNC